MLKILHALIILTIAIAAIPVQTIAQSDGQFNRIASFPVCRQLDSNCDIDDETVAEISAASDDGMTLIYTDGPMEQIGFIDITMPSQPQAAGVLGVGGEPTSVAVAGDYALAAVNTSADFVDVSGELVVVEIASQTIVSRLSLPGQPDSIAVSPDRQYLAVVLENERDEDLGDGAPPQLPAGSLLIVDMQGAPADWSSRVVELTGLADRFAADPEPEYVDINADNIAVITLQENNYLILVDLVDGSIVNHFSAGAVDLAQIDASEEDPALISLSESLAGVPREPDGVSWVTENVFATADEGDLDGGSRGFTLFNVDGQIVWSSGNRLDHLAVRYGHYPDDRSGNKGNEPENVDVGVYQGDRFLFVASERASLVFVYRMQSDDTPVYVQTLPAAAGPEGVLTIASRNLLVVASEVDDRGDKLRSAVNIYEFGTQSAEYPTLVSADRADGTPIPWGAISGLASTGNGLVAVHDSFYQRNRILQIDTRAMPAVISAEITIRDTSGALAALPVVALNGADLDADDPARIDAFDEADLAALINDDGSINLDPEGIAVSASGGYWVVSEGNGTIGDDSRPLNAPNLLLKVAVNGDIEQVVTLPEDVSAMQLRFGFEGVAEYDNEVFVAFQRAWGSEDHPRIGAYDPTTGNWRFWFYPLQAPSSQNGGWVGLSEITPLGDGRFLVVERDNQGGPDAAIKRLYTISPTQAPVNSVLDKTLHTDLMAALAAPGGLIAEKIEGAALGAGGEIWIVNDNDGVDDNSGETQLMMLAVDNPACIDTDGDGWGWDGVRSCLAGDILRTACIDPDGDGWGWDGVESCRPDDTSGGAPCVDSDGDGWGWDGSRSCRVGDIPRTSCIDTDGDGWGWDGLQTCLP